MRSYAKDNASSLPPQNRQLAHGPIMTAALVMYRDMGFAYARSVTSPLPPWRSPPNRTRIRRWRRRITAMARRFSGYRQRPTSCSCALKLTDVPGVLIGCHDGDWILRRRQLEGLRG